MRTIKVPEYPFTVRQLSKEDYQNLTTIKENIIDLLSMPPDASEIDFEPAKLKM